MTNPALPLDLPVPDDDGAADHVAGMRLPAIALPTSDGGKVSLDDLTTRSVVFVYPGIGGYLARDDRLEEWTAIPGARGCTAEACSFRDELTAFRELGVRVLGLAAEDSEDQREHVQRLGLPYPLLSDDSLELSDAPLGLPTFEFHDRRYFKRLTLVVSQGMIEAALYPVFPPDQGAAQALTWLSEHPHAS